MDMLNIFLLIKGKILKETGLVMHCQIITETKTYIYLWPTETWGIWFEKTLRTETQHQNINNHLKNMEEYNVFFCEHETSGTVNAL